MGEVSSQRRPVVVVSACLAGDAVRYDGNHKRHAFMVDGLGDHVDFVRVCPEFEAGFGVPREPIELVQTADSVVVKTVESNRDVTQTLSHAAKQWLEKLDKSSVDAFILKRGSPSCGVANVKVRQPDGEVARTGVGVFASAARSAFPNWAIISEDQLANPTERFCFLTRLFASQRARQLFSRRVSADEVARFHDQERMLILAFSQKHLHRLNDLVCNVKKYLADDFARAYQRHFRAALASRPTFESVQRVTRKIGNLLADVFECEDVETASVAPDSPIIQQWKALDTLHSIASANGVQLVTRFSVFEPFPRLLEDASSQCGVLHEAPSHESQDHA